MSVFHKRCYQYCGPGTNLKKRLARGDKGINLLDSACREHDIAYEQSNSIADRNKADYILEQRAWDRFKSIDSSLKEKAVAWGVTTAMKAKRKVGGGCGFKAALKATKNVMMKNIGNSSELSCEIFPPLEVENTAQICLLSLQTNNSIPNIEPGCNTIAFRNLINNNEYVIIPTGTYELDQLESIIQKMMPDFVSFFELKANSRTLKCSISCSHDVDLEIENSIAKLLGFRNVLYTTGATHESENIVNIMKINCIKVDCNLITGSFCDGAPSQTIHELYLTVPAGYKIVEVPRHPVFYGLNTTSITKVNIVLKDQNDCLINLRGKPITVRLQITRGYGA
ncbi:hypothetical protein QTP88_028089 [Uroleucon formosanum]